MLENGAELESALMVVLVVAIVFSNDFELVPNKGGRTERIVEQHVLLRS